MDGMTMTPERIRLVNRQILITEREHRAQLGSLWYAVEQRGLWKEWGYTDFDTAAEQECKKDIKTLREYMANYSYFVIELHLPYNEFQSLVVLNGTRKTSHLRQQAKIEYPKGESTAPVEEKQERVREIAREMAPLSTSQTKEALKIVADNHGVELYQVVHENFHWPKDRHDLINEAIKHIMCRCPQIITRDEAIALMAEEYCAEKGLREPVPYPWMVKNAA